MRSNSIPKGMLAIYEKIVGLTDDICDGQLNSEYRDLARAMTGALCRKRPSPLTSGQRGRRSTYCTRSTALLKPAQNSVRSTMPGAIPRRRMASSC